MARPSCLPSALPLTVALRRGADNGDCGARDRFGQEQLQRRGSPRKLEEANAREEHEKLQAYRAEVIGRRDAAAEGLERYPVLANEMGNILAQVQASNAEVESVNRDGGGPEIEPAESVAPGMAANSIHWLLTGVILPDFDPREHAMARSVWPPSSPVAVALPPLVVARSAAIGEEARRIGEEVGQWRAENDANPARKRLPP
jgi:hypothetical protein